MQAKVIGVLVAIILALASVLGVWKVMADNRTLKEDKAKLEQQTRNDGESIRQLDRYHNTTTIIREREGEAVDAVQAAPGADAPIDPDRRAILCEQLGRMRNAPVCEDHPSSSVP